jgi:hypothetical protein
MDMSQRSREGTALQQFTILVDQLPTDEQVDAIVDRFPDLDIGRSPRKPIGHIYVDREAGSLEAAIGSALRDVESIGLRPIQIEEDGIVTLEEIADRIATPRETVRRWATGVQGPGGFPTPTNPGRATAFYRWVEVAAWLRERMELGVQEVEPVLVVANHILQLRTLAPRVKDMEALWRLLIAPSGGRA